MQPPFANAHKKPLTTWICLILVLIVVSSCQPVIAGSFSRIPTGPAKPSASPQAITPTYTPTPTFTATPTSPISTIADINEVHPPTTPTETQPPTSTPQVFYSGPHEIGSSVAGRPIIIHRFGSGPVHRLIIAGIHGGYEWNTIKLANLLVETFIENPDLIPDHITLYILPSLNPDGEARGHGPVGRANDHGVDLNRNFPVNWKLDWARTGCWQMGPITAGEHFLSEPESKAVVDFLLSKPVDAVISYHSAGLGIFPGGIPSDSNSTDLAITLARVSSFPYPPMDTGCEFTGTLADFAANLGIAAVDLELTTHWDPELDMNLKVLEAFLDWAPQNQEKKDLPLPAP
jgi:hypothetical protein